MNASRPALRPTRTGAAATALVVLSALALGVPTPAAAVCPVTSACSATAFTSNPSCCTATACTIDSNVTVSGAACLWDFGARNVTLSGTTTLGSSTLQVRTTGMVMVAGSAKVFGTDGGLTIDAGGAVTLDTNTLIEMSLSGDVDIIGSEITARGRIETDAGLGAISLEATSGPIEVIRPSTEGLSALGGSITLRTDITTPGAGILLNTPIGAEGGDVDVEAAGRVEVQRTIEVGDNAGDGGGDVSLVSLLNDVVLSGAGRLVGSDTGDGGTATLDAARDVIVQNEILMRGLDGGSGGDVSVSAGRDALFQSNGDVDASGTGGPEDLVGDGGIVDVAAARNVTLAATVQFFANAGGTGTNGGIGGLVDLDAGSVLLGFGPVSGNLTINGRIEAEGHSEAGNDIILGGCQVTIASGAQVDARGDLGSTTAIVARTAVTVAGQLRSNQANVVELPVGAAFTTTGGTITPGSTPGACFGGSSTATACRREVCVADGEPEGCLEPCPTCGNGVTEYPEECDGGATNRCESGCTPLCRDELCESGNPCLETGCDPIGGCHIAGITPNGTACDDSTVCNGREECRSGICQLITGSVPSCGEDGNPCTTASCDAAAGCIQTPTPGPDVPGCDDGNACTGDEVCNAEGECEPGQLVTCQPGFICAPQSGECEQAPACEEASDCDDTNPCTTDTCNAMSQCVNTPFTDIEVAGCDDFDACNGVEECVAGQCVQETPPVCDDGNSCTTETCVAASGCTEPEPIANCCETPDDCGDDGNPCTANTCVDRQCGETAVPECCQQNAECDDGNQCTPAAVCQNNTCISMPPTPCEDDGDLCTDDFCDPAAGCVHVEIEGCCSSNAECDDGTACTTDTCDPVFHTCSNVQEDDLCVACDETDVFSCSPMGACASTACVDGACVAQEPPDCDDEDECTDDSCDPAEGCQNELRIEDPACTSIPCTGDAECADTDLCTVDTCDQAGTCRQTPAEGVAAVSCRLDGADAALAGAGEDLITSKSRRKVEKKLGAVRKKLQQAQDKLDQGKTKPAAARYKSAGKLLGKCIRFVQKQRGKSIDANLATELVRLLSEAQAAVDGVRTGLVG
jgi:hypothetical protein